MNRQTLSDRLYCGIVAGCWVLQRLADAERFDGEPEILPIRDIKSPPVMSRIAGRVLGFRQKWIDRGIKYGLGVVFLLSGCATQVDHGRTAIHAGSPPHVHGAVRFGAAYNRPYKVRGRVYRPLRTARGYHERGIASWYGWESGSRTSMGTRFDPKQLTAAHRTLPLPTRVKVTNLANRRSIVVLVNDRGPFIDGRLIDLSYGAAKALRLNGLGRVEVEALD
jgi:rare lipoprotein A